MIRRNDELSQQIQFLRIKDLHYFKLLLTNYDMSVVRDFLIRSLEQVTIYQGDPYALDPDFTYISNQDAIIRIENTAQMVSVRQGYPLKQKQQTITSQETLVLYRLTLKIEYILQHLFFLNMPLLKTLKSSERFGFYQLCSTQMFNFGSYVYKKGEFTDAIYYILEGQIKIFKKRKQKVLQLSSLEKGRMFGIYCFKQQRQTRLLFARASQNGTKILIIYRSLLQKICLEKQITLQKLLEDIQSQLFTNYKVQASSKKENRSEGQKTNNNNSLEKRVKRFQKDRNVKNKMIENLAQTKSLLYKVKNLTISAINQSKEYKISLNTPSQIVHYNDKWRRIKTNSRSNFLLTKRQSNQAKYQLDRSLIRAFGGLNRYPSVRQYQSRMSKRGDIIRFDCADSKIEANV